MDPLLPHRRRVPGDTGASSAVPGDTPPPPPRRATPPPGQWRAETCTRARARSGSCTRSLKHTRTHAHAHVHTLTCTHPHLPCVGCLADQDAQGTETQVDTRGRPRPHPPCDPGGSRPNTPSTRRLARRLRGPRMGAPPNKVPPEAIDGPVQTGEAGRA